MHATEQIDHLPTDLTWSVPASDTIKVSKTSQHILFEFEWFGSLFIDPDMGLMFSVCDKLNINNDQFKCSDPEKMTFTPYQIALSYQRQPKLSVSLVILGLDIDGEPILSTGVQHFHCMLRVIHSFYYYFQRRLNKHCLKYSDNDAAMIYPRFIRSIQPGNPIRDVIFFNGFVLIFLTLLLWMICFCGPSSQSPAYKKIEETKSNEGEEQTTTNVSDGTHVVVPESV